ncbi:hypothetical protein E4T47_05031 [Aureobasidium subglaciale]|nr:hypothetical protein E4T47_05031 [Aureobasidium subglaciale]
MPTGQTQRRFGGLEKKFEPGDIKDIKNMLNRSSPGRKIKNYKMVLGVMLFEVNQSRYVRRLGRIVPVRRFLVLGEDNNEDGYLAAMYLTDGNKGEPRLRTTHGRGLNDTRGGLPEVRWCSSLRFKGLTPAGRPSTSYTAHKRVRRACCLEVLSKFDDSKTWKEQDWHAIRNVIDSYKHLLVDDNHIDEKHDPEPDDPDPTHRQNNDKDSDSDDDFDDESYLYRRPKSEHELDSDDDDPNSPSPDSNDGDLDLDDEDDRPNLGIEDRHSDMDDENSHHSDSGEDRFDDDDHPGSDQDRFGGNNEDEEDDEEDGDIPKFGGSRNFDMDIDEILSEARNNISPSPSVRSRSQNRSLEYILIFDDVDMDVDSQTAHQSPVRPKIETMSPEPQTITHRTQLFDTTQDDSTSYIDLTEDPIIEVIEIED